MTRPARTLMSRVRWKPQPIPEILRSLSLLLLLATLAAAGSYLELPLFFGLRFSFGLVAVLLALVWLGLPAALLVAAVQCSVTWLLYGQPISFLLVGSLTLFVGCWLAWARRRGRSPPSLALSVSAYWLLLSIPLALAYALSWIAIEPGLAAAVLMQKAVNDLVAALLAELIVLAVGSLRRHQASLSNRHVLFVLLTAATLLPAFSLVVLGVRDLQGQLEESLRQELRLYTALAAETLAAGDHQTEGQTTDQMTGQIGGPTAGQPPPQASGQTEPLQQRLETLLADNLPAEADPRVRLLAKAGTETEAPPDSVIARRNGLMLINERTPRPSSCSDWSQMRYRLSVPMPAAAVQGAIQIEISARLIMAQLCASLRLWLFALLGWTALAILTAHWLSRRLAAPLQSLIQLADLLPPLVDSGQPMPPPPRSPLKEEVDAARAMIALGNRLRATFGALARERDLQQEQRALAALQAETLGELITTDADGREVAEHLCQRIAELMPTHQCSLVLANASGLLEVLAAPGLDAQGIAQRNERLAERPRYCSQGRVDCAFHQAFESVAFSANAWQAHSPDEQRPRFDPVPDTPSTCWCQPVRGQDGQAVGVLSLTGAQPAVPSRFARALLEHGASLAAISLTHLQLRRDHQILLEALSQADTGIVVAEHVQGGDHPVRFVSKGFESLTGYRAEEAMGQDCRFLQGTDRDQPERAMIREALDEGRPCQVTLRNYRKDGTLFWNSLSLTPVTDSKGAITHFIGVQRDDTERQRTLARLSASEAQLREITETIEEVFWVQEIGSDRLSYISPAFESIWERPVETILADSEVWRRSLHPEDRERMLQAQAEVPADGSLKSLEYRILTPDGQLKWISDRRFLARDAQGRPRRVVGVAAEITERKQSEITLREQRQRLEQIIAGTRVGTWDWRITTDSVHCNERWAAMLGYRLEEVEPIRRASWRALVHPDDLEAAEHRLEAHFNDERRLFECEFRMRHKEGHWVWIQSTGRLVERSPDGRPQRAIGIHLEVSERKQAELDLIHREQLEREMVALTTRFVDTSDQPFDSLVQEALAKVGELTNSDRAYLFQIDHNDNSVSNRYEWTAPGIEPMIATLQQIPATDLEALLSALEASDLVMVRQVSELSEHWAVLRQDLERQQVQSLIAVPLIEKDCLLGFIGLDAVCEERDWAGPDVHILRVLAGALVGALERERVLTELRASTERYDVLAQQSRMMTWEVDLQGTYTYVNPVAETLLGYAAEELIGRKAFYEFIPEPERTETKARAFALMAHHQPCRDFVCPYLNASGRRVWTSTDALPIFADDGALIGYRGNTLDITDVQRAESERRAAEQALQRYVEQLEQLVNLSNRGLDSAKETAALLDIATDALGMSVAEAGWYRSNRPYQRLTCVPSAEDGPAESVARGSIETLFAATAAFDRPQLISGASLPEPLRSEGYASVVALASRCTGDAAQPCWLLTQLYSKQARSGLSGAERELLRFIGQRIAAIEHEAQLARELVSAKERETIGHLASGVAHDFNNVLAVLDANLYFLRSFISPDALGEDNSQVIDEMNSALGQAKVITSGMLALSRAGGVPMRTTKLELPLAELADILRMMLPETVNWHLELEPGLSACTNAGFLQAALLNLALNGRDAMPKGGTLRVSGRRERWSGDPPLMVGDLRAGDYAVLRMRDSGIGMSETTLARIFEPLFSTKTKQRGHGLGMFMVREFVVRSGAGLAVRSTPGAGTEFQFLLPLADPGLEEHA
ncbi:MAG: PAS domain S-box protein [Gammaproteobacteria bacterium]|nr:PAS domain S-box protein [Gammaproteobacteria bacterium]